jgi:hypothetical protein
MVATGDGEPTIVSERDLTDGCDIPPMYSVAELDAFLRMLRAREAHLVPIITVVKGPGRVHLTSF